MSVDDLPAPGAATQVEGLGGMRAAWRRVLADRVGSERLVLVASALFMVALAWPAGQSVIGRDNPWTFGLRAAAELNLRHGVDIAFTYGPLGFLNWPWPFVGATTALAIVFVALVKSGLAITIALAARTAFSLPLAVLVLFGAMRLTTLPPVNGEFLVVLVFIAAVLVLARMAPQHVDAILVAAGAVGAVALLGKVSGGVVTVAMVMVVAAAIGRPWWRGLGLAAGACATATLLLWLLAGQRITDLPAFAAAAAETVSGYASAMARAASGPPLARLDAVLEIGLLSVLGYLASRTWPARRRAALAIVWALFAGSMFLEGFTRDDAGHNTVFFFAMGLGAIAVLPRNRGAISAATLAGLASIAIVAGAADVRVVANPVPSVARFMSDVTLAAQPWRWNAAAAETGAAILAAYNLDPRLPAMVEGRTVHFDPIDAALPFALPGARWDPEPVFQAYAAYTASLDDMNAAFLGGPRAPERILRRKPVAPAVPDARATSVDGRLLWWEQPATTLEMVCRYREEAILGAFQVLARGSNRCGTPRTVATVNARVGEVVSISVSPAPDEILLVRVSPLPGTITQRVRDLLLGARPWHAVVDGVRYRLVPGTVGDGLLLAVPDAVGWSAGYSFGQPIRTLSLVGAPGSVTLEFQVVQLSTSP
jgi:hypothetical protein